MMSRYNHLMDGLHKLALWRPAEEIVKRYGVSLRDICSDSNRSHVNAARLELYQLVAKTFPSWSYGTIAEFFGRERTGVYRVLKAAEVDPPFGLSDGEAREAERVAAEKSAAARKG